MQTLPGQQIELRPARAQRVVHLVGRAGRAAGHRRQLTQIGDIEVAHAPLADQAAPLQLLEATHGLGQRRVATPVQQVQVDVLQRQAAQAALAGRHHGGLARVLRQHLADDEQIVPRQVPRPLAQRATERLAEHGFSAAVAVHLGRVDDAVAHVQRQAQGADLGGGARGLLAEAPGAQAQRRALLAAGEGHVTGNGQARPHAAILAALLRRWPIWQSL